MYVQKCTQTFIYVNAYIGTVNKHDWTSTNTKNKNWNKHFPKKIHKYKCSRKNNKRYSWKLLNKNDKDKR